jgi:hypothetical protein
MANLVVIAFEDAEEAGRVRKSLRDLEKQGLLSLDDSAVIVKDAEGKVEVKKEMDRGIKVGAGPAHRQHLCPLCRAHRRRARRGRCGQSGGSGRGPKVCPRCGRCPQAGQLGCLCPGARGQSQCRPGGPEALQRPDLPHLSARRNGAGIARHSEQAHLKRVEGLMAE